jgi:hypothetical protein
VDIPCFSFVLRCEHRVVDEPHDSQTTGEFASRLPVPDLDPGSNLPLENGSRHRIEVDLRRQVYDATSLRNIALLPLVSAPIKQVNQCLDDCFVSSSGKISDSPAR